MKGMDMQDLWIVVWPTPENPRHLAMGDPSKSKSARPSTEVFKAITQAGL